MRFTGEKLVRGEFIERPNRFLVRAKIKGKTEDCHLPDPGRLKELLYPGATLLLSHNPAPHRKTAFTCRLVKKGNIWVSIHSITANLLFSEGIEKGIFGDFAEFRIREREYSLGKHRYDFLLDNGKERKVVEVKSVTLVKDTIAFFPDAVTTRGKRHVESLLIHHQDGIRVALVFIVQREDAKVFSPQWDIDPEFSKALQKANSLGIPIYAYSFRVSPEEIKFFKKLAVRIDTEREIFS